LYIPIGTSTSRPETEYCAALRDWDVRFVPKADSCTAAIHLSQLTPRQATETMQARQPGACTDRLFGCLISEKMMR
jgi:hypothetical protein